MTTEIKQNFLKFKNKVDLTDRDTFGYYELNSPVNKELYVHLNDKLSSTVSNMFKPTSITNYNIKKDINSFIRLFWNSKIDSNQVKNFYDTSLFDDKEQPDLIEYTEYRGNVFEFYERMRGVSPVTVSRQQEVKDKYIDWFDPRFLTTNGLKKISKYIFYPNKYSIKSVDGEMLKNNISSYKYNEYFRVQSNKLNGIDIPEDIITYVTANSNSIRPSRIYYKNINTEISQGQYDTKLIFPLYLVGDLGKSIMGLSVIEKGYRHINLHIVQSDPME